LNGLNISRQPTAETIEEAKISFDFEAKHKTMVEKKSIIDASPFFIHSFWALGMADPFPDESTMIDTDN
jgi:hypothetical protein